MEGLDVSVFIEQQKQAIRELLGDQKAIVAVSGGVDSTVSAVITHRAVGDNLICVFIDDNFMRLGEAEQVKKMLTSETLNLPLRILNERQRFMEALSGIKKYTKACILRWLQKSNGIKSRKYSADTKIRACLII